MAHHGWRELPDAQRKGRTWQVHRPPRDHHDPGHPRLPRQNEPIQWRLSIWRETQISRKLNWNISFHLMIPKLKVAKAPERLWVFADLWPGAVWCRLSVSIVSRCPVSSKVWPPNPHCRGEISWPWPRGEALLPSSLLADLQWSSILREPNQWKSMKNNGTTNTPFGSFQNWWKHGWNTRTSESMASHPPSYTSLFLSCTNLDTLCVWTNVCIHMPTSPFSAPACSPQRRKAAANWLRSPMVSTWSCSHGGPRWAWCLRTTIITRITRIPCPTCNSYVLPERQELHWKSTASCAQSIRAMRQLFGLHKLHFTRALAKKRWRVGQSKSKGPLSSRISVTWRDWTGWANEKWVETLKLLEPIAEEFCAKFKENEPPGCIYAACADCISFNLGTLGT